MVRGLEKSAWLRCEILRVCSIIDMIYTDKLILFLLFRLG